MDVCLNTNTAHTLTSFILIGNGISFRGKCSAIKNLFVKAQIDCEKLRVKRK